MSRLIHNILAAALLIERQDTAAYDRLPYPLAVSFSELAILTKGVRRVSYKKARLHMIAVGGDGFSFAGLKYFFLVVFTGHFLEPVLIRPLFCFDKNDHLFYL